MKVLHLSAYDVYGGAARAAHRLHLGLRAAGSDSQMWVRRPFGRAPGVQWPRGAVRQAAIRMTRRIDRWIATAAGRRGAAGFSPGVAGWPLGRAIARLAPDVVHAHWITDGFIAARDLRNLDHPLVWTLHDMWPFSGGCHYAGSCSRFEASCGRCPLLGGKRERDLSRRMWSCKARTWKNLRLVGVAPSRWLADAAGRSSLLRGREIRTIPNGIDTAKFAPRDRVAARAKLGLPEGKRLVVAGAASFRTEPRKGFDLFGQLAARLAASGESNYAFAVFGTDPAGPIEACGVAMNEWGAIRSEDDMAAIYAAADVFVAPSREDNLPNTVLESMACGTPAAAFAIGGLPEVIEDGACGCLAEPFAIAELAEKIHRLVSSPENADAVRAAARRRAEQGFSIARMVRDYIDLYAELAAAVR